MPHTTPPTPLKLYVLGPFRVKSEQDPLPLPARKDQSLLAYLVLHPQPSGHTREKLAALLWGDSPDAQARSSLRTALKNLRQQLGTHLLLADRETIQINPASPLWVDAREFEEQMSSAPESAIALYSGELLADLYDDWIFPERERYRELYLNALLELTQAARAASEYGRAIEYAHKVLAADPANERAHQHLMFCDLALGDRSAALKQYDACARALQTELAVEPSRETTALYQWIKQTPSERASLAAQITNLPIPLSSFIGRKQEVTELKERITTSRLLTLTGAGGSGKTRLTIQVATDLIDQFHDGVWWVGLAPLSDEALVPHAVAQALGVREIPNQPLRETLISFLHHKRLLLVLDNCEHLIAACAQLVDDLLTHCAKLRILATSREALGIIGESVYQVPTLSLPYTLYASVHQVLEHEATRLFVERALAAKADFALNEQNAFAVGQICQRLDGIPLAIELAAARVKVLFPREIAARLDNRFELLTSGSRTALPRHQTLRATIDWSHNLLTEPERILFRRLSVFAGGFMLDAAKEVCSGAGLKQVQLLDLLSHLVDKSLILAEAPHPAEEGARYRSLETIREYAREKLREAEEQDVLSDRHLEFFVNWVEEVEPKLEHAKQLRWLDRLELEIDNLRTAIDWALESQKTNTALRLVSGLRRFWFIRNHHTEGVERLKTILDRPDAIQPTPARLKALNTYLFMLWPSGQLAEVQPVSEETLALARQLGDRWNTAVALLWLGVGLTSQGDYPPARSYLEQSLEIWRELGDMAYTGCACAFLGELAALQGDIARAQALCEQAVVLLNETKDYPFLAIPLRHLGQFAMFQGELLKAKALINESLQHNWTTRDYRGVGACLAALGGLSMVQGERKRAAQLFGVVDTVLKLIGTSMNPFDQQQYEHNLSQLREQLEEVAFGAAWAKGRALTLEQAIEYALEEREVSV
jgi:predicted ATPase/DNA-binding SARP family transcriptional activator